MLKALPSTPPAPQTAVGATLADRFVLESFVGEGGMAVVYKARDLQTQAQVAVKLLHRDTKSSFILDHFVHEAEILSALRHPNIVSYITHGQAPGGEAFLAMEWLEGEDLERRLRRGSLSIHEVVTLAKLVTSALAATHERGIVHRDIKPSNLYLRERRVDAVKLLDFGVARRMANQVAVTRTGAIVGTPEYMAPEQVRGERTVGPPADLFALGCVLYECLTGRPPFFGEQVVAVLAKILFEDPPDIRKARPGVPAALVALLSQLLNKDPAQRLPDGRALFDALQELPHFEEDSGATAVARDVVARPSGLRGNVQELLTVVVATAPGFVQLGDDRTRAGTAERLDGGQRELLQMLRDLEGHAHFMLDGSLVAVFRKWASATDQAVQATHAALLIHERWAEAQVAVTTGRGAAGGELAVGEALDRAARLLMGSAATSDGAETTANEVLLDEVTTNLVAGRFEVKKSGASYLLRGPRLSLDDSRPLLGKPTPCVGRERELSQLETLFAATADEPVAQAVLVTGPPGSGKSRLRHEFLRRLAARGHTPLLLIARGAHLSMGTAFGMLSQALRGLCGLNEPSSDDERRRRFAARIGEKLTRTQAARVVPFLAELCQLEGETQNEAVRAARQDPGLMYEQLSRAFVDFLTAECAAQPVLILLEDLHWGDAPTVRMIDVVLRDLADQPLFVLTLSRPEVHELYPKLWQQRQRHDMPLWGLSRRACERLIHEVLGRKLPPELESRIIDQAAGNALYLEELIRAVAEGKTEGIPETVLAMLQARLSRLPGGARTVLCAASLYGSTFWQAGVGALLVEEQTTAVDTWLPHLVGLELITRHKDSRLGGDVEYSFRHDLLRDAAYGLLSDDDRVLGHLLAAQYLEAAGEREAMALAEHYRRGGARDKAAHYFHVAAEQALEANELTAAQKRAKSALDAGAEGIERGQLFGLLAAAAYWQRDDGETRRCAEQALEFLPLGSSDFYVSAAHLLVSSGRLKEWDTVSRWLDTVLKSQPADSAAASLSLCLSRTGFMFMMAGRLAEMKQIAEQLAQRAGAVPESEPAALAQLHHFRSGYGAITGDPVGAIKNMEKTVEYFERAGDQRNALLERSNLACMNVEMGCFEAGERLCRENLVECEQAKSRPARTLSLVILGYGLTFTPEKRPEARRVLTEAVAEAAALGIKRHEGWATASLARLSYLEGDDAQAETYARRAIELMTQTPTFLAWPLGWLSRALTRQGRIDEAVACAEEAQAKLKAFGSYTMDLSVPPLAQVEALRAAGRVTEAQEATRHAKRRIQKRLERIVDERFRAHFLNHPENAATLALPD